MASIYDVAVKKWKFHQWYVLELRAVCYVDRRLMRCDKVSRFPTSSPHMRNIGLAYSGINPSSMLSLSRVVAAGALRFMRFQFLKCDWVAWVYASFNIKVWLVILGLCPSISFRCQISSAKFHQAIAPKSEAPGRARQYALQGTEQGTKHYYSECHTHSASMICGRDHSFWGLQKDRGNESLELMQLGFLTRKSFWCSISGMR